MNFQFTHPQWLLLLLPVWAWVLWLALKTDVQIGVWRRWIALGLRMAVTLLVVLAIAGLQWKKPMEGMNVFFLLDRSDSIPSPQQEAARKLVNRFADGKKKEDKTGLLVFGTEAAIEATASDKIDPKDTKILAVVGTEELDRIAVWQPACARQRARFLAVLQHGLERRGDTRPVRPVTHPAHERQRRDPGQ